MTVHLFERTCSPSCCTYALQRAFKDFGSTYPEAARHAVMRNFYADDLLKSMPSEASAVEVAVALRDMLQKAGFSSHQVGA